MSLSNKLWIGKCFHKAVKLTFRNTGSQGVQQKYVIYCVCPLQFVSKSFDELDSEEWLCSLGAEMAAQIPLYSHFPEEKVKLMQQIAHSSSNSD